MKVIVVDDESLARKRSIDLLTDIKDIDSIIECSSGSEAIKLILSEEPNFIILDIQLLDMTGFEVLQSIPIDRRPLCIFISAHHEYALKAFDISAFDYILKPFKDQRFLMSIKKAISFLKVENSLDINNKIDDLINYMESLKHGRLSIRQNGRALFLEKDDIQFIKASGDYAEINTNLNKYVIRETLSTLIKEFGESTFFRIHRSTIINTSYIKEVVFSNYGEFDVKLMNDKIFRVSKSYKKEFQKKMNL